MKKNNLRDKAIKAINETNFYPSKGKERLLSMVEEAVGVYLDKKWGVPLPIFINKKTKEPLRDKKVINRIAAIYENKVPIVGSLMILKFFWEMITMQTIMRS